MKNYSNINYIYSNSIAPLSFDFGSNVMCLTEPRQFNAKKGNKLKLKCI